jgi:hypothetical protein
MSDLTAVDAEKQDNVIEEIKDLRERLEQLERHALTSLDIKANKIAVGDSVSLEDVSDQFVDVGGRIRAGTGIDYTALGLNAGGGLEADVVYFREGDLAGILRLDPNDDLVWRRYNPPGTFQDDGLTLESSDGDIYTEPWTDYSGSSSLDGWASTTEKRVHYKRFGNIVWAWFRIVGTSNANNCTFTLPYDGKQASWVFPILSTNAGVQAMAYCTKSAVGGIVTCVPNATGGGTGWSSTGTKAVYGHICYERTP